MSRSSEEVLLIVNKVKNKKCEGSLYLMGQRMAWMSVAKDTFTVSHSYADIKVQKISPDTKDKVQLQIVLHDGGANTFHFNNPNGRAAQQKDREAVKELLQQLLPKFRRKVNSELEAKHRMLQEDPELCQLYKDLVVSGVISADEFWSNRAKEKQNPANMSQDVGVSAAFLSEVKPHTDGCNGLKYNLTKDIIQSIFRTYPTVKQKHAEYVPDKISEQEFWTKFFQSHYFHRDRVSFGTKDLFTECAKRDDKDMAEEMLKPFAEPLVDLTSITDDITGSGYGSEPMDNPITSANPANASLLHRFNQHSTMVLKAGEKRPAESESSNLQTNGQMAGGDAAHTNGKASAGKNGPAELDGAPKNKRAKLLEKIEYADLETTKSVASGPSLRLTNMDRYLHGPTPATATQYNTSEDSLQACHSLTSEVMVWDPRLSQVLPNQTAVSVLWELTPGGALMQSHTQQQLHQLVPQDSQDELRHLYSALCELLRHYWACFPVTTKLLEEKVLRMKANLDKFQTVKLAPLKQKLHGYHYNMNLLGHIEEMLDAAHKKFTLWQSKQRTFKKS